MTSPLTTCARVLFQLHVLFDAIWIVIYCIPAMCMTLYYAIFGRTQKEVSGEIVLITGSGQGLGRELSIRFARLGCEVICVDILPEMNQETLKLIREEGGKATGYICDVSDRKAIMKLADEIKRVDILINNAGVYPMKGIWNATEEDIRTVLDINLMSQFWTVQAFMPAMKERRRGHIVAISSLAGVVSLPYLHAYSTSKAAVSAFMMCLSHELRIENLPDIKLTTIHPYFIKTRSEITECVDVRIPALEVGESVDDMVRGIRENLTSFSVPRELMHIVNFGKMYPDIYLDKWFKTFPVIITEPKEDAYEVSMKEFFNKNKGTFKTQ